MDRRIERRAASRKKGSSVRLELAVQRCGRSAESESEERDEESGRESEEWRQAASRRLSRVLAGLD
jgi:hypothetical protein